jgi:hypothetical protein
VSEWVLAETQGIGNEEDNRAADGSDPKEEHIQGQLKAC